MNERLFERLAERLASAPAVLASVIATRGATPRKSGARMLVSALGTDFTIGGGLAEARVIAAATTLLGATTRSASIEIDLTGGADAAGVCGGRMEIALRRWDMDDRPRAAAIAAALTAGEPVDLCGDDIGDARGAMRIDPDARLVIVGGGHCGLALYEMARLLDVELWVYDARPEFANATHFPTARTLSGPIDALRAALDTRRDLYIVLLNRDFASDVATLRVIAGHRCAFLGMMGSARRIRQVLEALTPEQSQQLSQLQAPVGLPIGAQTPHEIAVSVLAHLIQARAQASHAGVRA